MEAIDPQALSAVYLDSGILSEWEIHRTELIFIVLDKFRKAHKHHQAY